MIKHPISHSPRYIKTRHSIYLLVQNRNFACGRQYVCRRVGVVCGFYPRDDDMTSQYNCPVKKTEEVKAWRNNFLVPFIADFNRFLCISNQGPAQARLFPVARSANVKVAKPLKSNAAKQSGVATGVTDRSGMAILCAANGIWRAKQAELTRDPPFFENTLMSRSSAERFRLLRSACSTILHEDLAIRMEWLRQIVEGTDVAGTDVAGTRVDAFKQDVATAANVCNAYWFTEHPKAPSRSVVV